jgi:hypothetical protein
MNKSQFILWEKDRAKGPEILELLYERTRNPFAFQPDSIANFYVRIDGDDANDGLSTTTAKRTVQAMWSDMARNYDFRANTAKINIGPGTFSSTGVSLMTSERLTGASGVIIEGAGINQTIVRSEAERAIVFVGNYAPSVQIGGLHLQSVPHVGHSVINVSHCPLCYFHQDTRIEILGGAQSYGIVCDDSLVYPLGDLYLKGSGIIAIQAHTKGVFMLYSGKRVILEGTPAYSQAFLHVSRISYVYIPSTIVFSGTATGIRWRVSSNSIIQTNGAGDNRLPGNQAGITDANSGGRYV